MPHDFGIGDGKCVACHGHLGVVFKRLRVETGVINARDTIRHHALGVSLGSHALADVMGPTDLATLVQFVEDRRLCVCMSCYALGIDQAKQVEALNATETEVTR